MRELAPTERRALAAWRVSQSGPGAARAAAAAAHAIDAGASVLVSWGLAGGLAAALAPGTVVAPRRVLAQGAEPIGVDAAWHASLAALADEFALDYGDLLSVPAALESPAAKRAAAAATRAVAVDMESAAIAAAAARARVPFVALRVVVDGVGDALPQGAERWIDERGRSAHGGNAAGRRELAAMAAALDVGRSVIASRAAFSTVSRTRWLRGGCSPSLRRCCEARS